MSNKMFLLQNNDFKLIVLEVKETSFVTKPPEILRKEDFFQTFLYLKSWVVMVFLGLIIHRATASAALVQQSFLGSHKTILVNCNQHVAHFPQDRSIYAVDWIV